MIDAGNTDRLEVRRIIPAPAPVIFAVLRDPEGHVDIDSSGMLMEAEGGVVSKAGDRFVVHMDREALNDYPLGTYDVTVVIVTFEPDREIAWTIEGQIKPPLGHVYGYRLEPADSHPAEGELPARTSTEHTVVTSYYDWSNIDESWRRAGIFPVLSEGALRATLGILDRTVRKRLRSV